MPFDLATFENDLVVGAAAAVSKYLLRGVRPLWDAVRHIFGHEPAAVQSKALENTGNFGRRYLAQLQDFVAQGVLSEAYVAESADDVGLRLLIRDAVAHASETDDAAIHEYLARLVAQRMRAGGGSVLAFNARKAVEAIRMVTPRQLKLLGALYFAKNLDIRWKGFSDVDAEFAKFVRSLEHDFGPFERLTGDYLDLKHLEGLGLLTVSDDAFKGMHIGDPGPPRPILGAIESFGAERVHGTPIVAKIMTLWVGDRAKGVVPLKYVTSLPSGLLLGTIVFDSLTGNRSDYNWPQPEID